MLFRSQQLSTFSFPGNVRQLENICHWLTVMAPAQVIEPKDLPPEVAGSTQDQIRTAPPLDSPKAGSSRVEPAVQSGVTSLPVPAEASAVPGTIAPSAVAAVLDAAVQQWEIGLEIEAQALLETGCSDVWDVLTRRFESKLIQTALLNTRGRRIEAAQKLGIGRNTITRKIQELNLE